MYSLKIRTVKYDRQPGDEVVVISAYLSDSTTFIPITNEQGSIKYFDIRVPKSSLPVSDYLDHIEALSEVAIADAFNFTVTASIEDTQNFLTLAASEVQRILRTMAVTGPGTDTDVLTVDSSTKVTLSDAMELQFTGDLASPTETQNGDLTTGSYLVENLSDASLLSEGMSVSGTGLPSGTFVSAILGITSISLTQAALLTQTSSLTFSPTEGADLVSNVNPAVDESFVGLSVEAANLPSGTTIAEVVSSSSIRLSQLPLSSSIGEILLVSGVAELLLSMDNVTIDLSELTKVTDLINFDQL